MPGFSNRGFGQVIFDNSASNSALHFFAPQSALTQFTHHLPLPRLKWRGGNIPNQSVALALSPNPCTLGIASNTFLCFWPCPRSKSVGFKWSHHPCHYPNHVRVRKMWAGMLEFQKLSLHLLWGLDVSFANAGAAHLSKSRGHEGERGMQSMPLVWNLVQGLCSDFRITQHGKQCKGWNGEVGEVGVFKG